MLQRRRSAPEPLSASGGCTTLSSSFLNSFIFEGNKTHLAPETNFVKFVSGAKCVLLPSKRNKITAINVLLLILPHFCIIFHFKFCTVAFVVGGRKNVSCPKVQGIYPSYATESLLSFKNQILQLNL